MQSICHEAAQQCPLLHAFGVAAHSIPYISIYVCIYLSEKLRFHKVSSHYYLHYYYSFLLLSVLKLHRGNWIKAIHPPTLHVPHFQHPSEAVRQPKWSSDSMFLMYKIGHCAIFILLYLRQISKHAPWLNSCSVYSRQTTMNEDIQFSLGRLPHIAWLCYIICPSCSLNRFSSLLQVYFTAETRQCNL